MAKRPGSSNSKKRIPKLSYTKTRGIGWHVSFRDAKTGSPRKHLFRVETEEEARIAYHEWLAAHLRGDAPEPAPATRRTTPATAVAKPAVPVPPNSLLAVASSYLAHETRRARKPGEPKRPGTIDARVLVDREQVTQEFLAFLNERHGEGAVRRMTLGDLAMADVEEYNRRLAIDRQLSSSQVDKRMHLVKKLVDRAGRPEHGQQVLSWNWDSRDVVRGQRGEARKLPTLEQLKAVLRSCGIRERALVWMGIGLGFGQKDLSVVRVSSIDAHGYDLRRSKTGLERYGRTPPLVWTTIATYLAASPREPGDLLFTTRNGEPLVHGRVDAVQQWWRKLRTKIGEDEKTMAGFYTLRHLGATEFGSRPGTSISEMRTWLGHGAGSREADRYMRPVAPEHRELVEWIRERLASPDLDYDLKSKEQAQRAKRARAG